MSKTTPQSWSQKKTGLSSMCWILFFLTAPPLEEVHWLWIMSLISLKEAILLWSTLVPNKERSCLLLACTWMLSLPIPMTGFVHFFLSSFVVPRWSGVWLILIVYGSFTFSLWSYYWFLCLCDEVKVSIALRLEIFSLKFTPFELLITIELGFCWIEFVVRKVSGWNVPQDLIYFGLIK